MNDERIDLSALEPDPSPWAARVQRTLLRVDAVLSERARGEDALTLIARWRRPVFAAAAAVVCLVIPVEWVLEQREEAAEPVRMLAQLSTQTLLDDQAPSGADLRAAVALAEVP